MAKNSKPVGIILICVIAAIIISIGAISMVNLLENNSTESEEVNIASELKTKFLQTASRRLFTRTDIPR